MGKYQPYDRPIPGHNYVLLERLDRGAIGEVWKAIRPGGGHCAIKIISDLDRHGGQKELSALWLLEDISHPNLITISGVWLKDRFGRIIDREQLTAEQLGSHVGSVGPDGSDEADSATASGAGKTASTTSLTAAADSSGARKQAARTAFFSARRRGARRPETRSTTDDSSGGEDSAEHVGPAAPAGPAAADRPLPAELIIAMGLGEQTLWKRLEACREQGLDGVPVPELLNYMQGAAKAIERINQEGIQHCDIKPQNILVIGGEAQVCDFGLAQAIDPDVRKTTTVGGSLAYSDPAVYATGQPVSTTDLYCLAATYVELRTGHLPFPADSRSRLIAAKENGELILDGLTDDEQQLVRQILVPHPDDRPQIRAVDFVEALWECHRDHPEVVVRGSRWLTWTLASVLAVALTVLIGVVVRGDDARHLANIQRDLQDELFARAAQTADLLDNQEARAEQHQVIQQSWLESLVRTEQTYDARQFAQLQQLNAAYPAWVTAQHRRQKVVERYLQDWSERVAQDPQQVRSELGDFLAADPLVQNDVTSELAHQLWMLWVVHELGEQAGVSTHPSSERLEERLQNWRNQNQADRGGQAALLRLLIDCRPVAAVAWQFDAGGSLPSVVASDLRRVAAARRDRPGELPPWAWQSFQRHGLHRLLDESVKLVADGSLSAESRQLIGELVGGDAYQLSLAEVRGLIAANQLSDAAARLAGMNDQLQTPPPSEVLQRYQHVVQLLTAVDHQQLRSLVGELTQPEWTTACRDVLSGAGWLHNFAWARLHHGMDPPQLTAAGEQAMTTLRDSVAAVELQPQQIVQLAAIVSDAADARITPTDLLSNSPFADGEATQARDLLETLLPYRQHWNGSAELARRLYEQLAVTRFYAESTEESASAVVEVAGWLQEQAPPATLNRRTNYVIAQALLRGPEKSAQVVEAYLSGCAEIVRDWQEQRRRLAAEQASLQLWDLTQQAVVPALRSVPLTKQSAQELSPAAARDLALLHGFLGWSILEDYYLRSKLQADPYETARRSFQVAQWLSPSVEYLVGQGMVLHHFREQIDPRGTLERMKALREAAAELDPTDPTPYLLGGYAALLSSRLSADYDSQLSDLLRAQADFESALERSGYEATIQVNLSTTLVELVAISPKQTPAQVGDAQTKLRWAIQLAKEALESEDPRLDYVAAWIARGNAEEDLALYGRELSSYEDAARSFEQALELTLQFANLRDPAWPRVCLGRCQYRQSRERSLPVSQRLAKLAQALRTLDHSAPSSRYEAERRFWRASAHALHATLAQQSAEQQASKQLAVDEFTAAAELARTKAPLDWPKYQLALIEFLAREGTQPARTLQAAQQLIQDWVDAPQSSAVSDAELTAAIAYATAMAWDERIREDHEAATIAWVARLLPHADLPPAARLELHVGLLALHTSRPWQEIDPPSVLRQWQHIESLLSSTEDAPLAEAKARHILARFVFRHGSPTDDPAWQGDPPAFFYAAAAASGRHLRPLFAQQSLAEADYFDDLALAFHVEACIRLVQDVRQQSQFDAKARQVLQWMEELTELAGADPAFPWNREVTQVQPLLSALRDKFSEL